MGVILVVGHGSALDSCTRPLLGLPPRDCTVLTQLVRKVCAPSFVFLPQKQAARRCGVTTRPSQDEDKRPDNPGQQGPTCHLRTCPPALTQRAALGRELTGRFVIFIIMATVAICYPHNIKNKTENFYYQVT